MKSFTSRKAVTGLAIGANLLLGTVATGVAQADVTQATDVTRTTSDQTGSEGVWVHPTFKGAQSAGYVRVPSNPALAQDMSRQRREAVAGFRVETDEHGRQWAYAHPTFRGAQSAGWVRVPVEAAK